MTKKSVIAIDWGDFVGVKGFDSVVAALEVPEISIMGAGTMDTQIIPPNYGYGYWYWLNVLAMGKGDTDTATDWPSAVQFLFLLAKIVRLATHQEHPVPVLWSWLSSIATILSSNIMLASLINYIVDRGGGCYTLISEYVIYYHYFNIE